MLKILLIKNFSLYVYKNYLFIIKKNLFYIKFFFFYFKYIENLLYRFFIGLHCNQNINFTLFLENYFDAIKKNIFLLNKKVMKKVKIKNFYFKSNYTTNYTSFLNKILIELMSINKNIKPINILNKVNGNLYLNYLIINKIFSLKKSNIPVESFKVRVKFSKRNVFFTLSTSFEKVLKKTTMKQEGYKGRMSKKYHSIMMVTRSLKNTLRSLRITSFDLIIIGWSRFRHAIKKAFKDNWVWLKKNKYKRFQKDFTYYNLKIPHNGCRSDKRKNKRRIKWKKFFSKPRIQVKKAKFFFVLWKDFIKNFNNKKLFQKTSSLLNTNHKGLSNVLIKTTQKKFKFFKQLEYLLYTNIIKNNLFYMKKRYLNYKV